MKEKSMREEGNKVHKRTREKRKVEAIIRPCYILKKKKKKTTNILQINQHQLANCCQLSELGSDLIAFKVVFKH